LAEYVTGDAKYRRLSAELLGKYHYDVLARRPLGTEPSERTHFDQELLGFLMPIAMTEPDAERKKIYSEALAFWGERVLPQNSPLFSFMPRRKNLWVKASVSDASR
jgi:hypothetical protein